MQNPPPVVYAYRGLVPVVDAEAFVHPRATLIGDVIVEAGCYIGPGASLRGDFGRVVVEQGSNIQDNCVLHAFPQQGLVVGRCGHVGHGAVLHGCRLERNVLVGMLALVMDEAVIGQDSIVAAKSLVKAKERVPPRSLLMGTPGRVVRALSDQEVAWKTAGTEEYQRLARHCLETLQETPALRRPEPDRPRPGTPRHPFFYELPGRSPATNEPQR